MELLEKFKRHYGKNLLEVALLGDTWPFVAKDGNRVGVETSQLWEGIEAIMHPIFGKFKILYAGYLRKILSEIDGMKCIYSPIKLWR
ncbi:MAG TPA: hypothetical protein EYH24_06000 [Thermococcus paralvinellae]|uniref:Uncharacterized protein n=1 Tax=Thermococcus paralvinellae TaxID=582419 RepID=A0A833E2B3_9EURY|nr:hypothetical protein [Thermococcus paralvinellae]